jgi:MFS family permease
MIRDYLDLPRPVHVLCMGTLINRAGSFVLVFLTIYASEKMGWGISFATACMGAFGLGSTVGTMWGGQLADQLGRRNTMLLALFGGAASLLLLSSLTNQWAFMLAVGLFAFVADMYRPAASAMIADHVPVHRRPHAFALMYISINLGFAIAPPIGGLLAEHSFAWLYWGDAITMVAYGCIILAVIPESRPQLRSRPNSLVNRNARESDQNTVNIDSNEISFQDAASRIASDRTFVWLCVSCLLMALVFMQAVSTLPIYLRQSGFSNLEYGLLMSVNGIMIVVLQLPVTHWLSRFNAMSVVIIGGILIAIGFGLTAVSTNIAFIALTITIWTSGEILQAPFKQSIVTDMAPPELRARYIGLFSVCYSSAMTIGAPIGGLILSRWGPTALWFSTFAIALTAVSVYISIRHAVTLRVSDTERDQPQPTCPPATVAEQESEESILLPSGAQ